jgi:hypothetical protein
MKFWTRFFLFFDHLIANFWVKKAILKKPSEHFSSFNFELNDWNNYLKQVRRDMRIKLDCSMDGFHSWHFRPREASFSGNLQQKMMNLEN